MAIDGDKVAAAYLDQWALTRQWCDDVDDWDAPSAVEGWRVRDLVAHLGLVADSIRAAGERLVDEAPLRLGDYLATYAEGAASIDVRTRDEGAREGFVFALDASAAQAEVALTSIQGNPVVAARPGPIRWVDFLRTRCIELTVHSDDLARSVVGDGPPVSRRCLQVSTRALADVLAWRAKGSSVEVRVPPFAAVQCVPGPRHTRGTPPAVVEMDPVTFCRLAAGRLTWAAATASGTAGGTASGPASGTAGGTASGPAGTAGGTVRTSGLRTDLSPYLPLL